MPIKYICILLFCHFLGDFLFQSREIATTKTTKSSSMFLHMWIIWVFTLITYILISTLSVTLTSCFTIILAALGYSAVHGFQDYLIWSTYAYHRNANINFYEDKNFYTLIGLDQMLHMLFLIVFSSFVLV